MGGSVARAQKKFAHRDRNVDGIKRKFAALHRKKIPTGDPLMPPEVKRAKHIRFKITERADLGEGNDANADDFFGDEDEEDIGPSPSSNPSQSHDDTVEIDVIESSLQDPTVVHAPATSTDAAPRQSTPTRSAMDLREPRPLVHRRVNVPRCKPESDDLLSILKAQIIQDGLRREEEHERREQERKDREDERRIERERRAEDSRRHDQLMQMMMMMICKGNTPNISNPSN